MHLSELLEHWEESLSTLYSKREARNMFYVLMEDVYSLSKVELIVNQSIQIDQIQELKLYLDRLKQGEPVQQIVGFTYFDNLKIKVTKDVLIPRPETEELVALVANSQLPKTANFLDLCTGSGCIALALKKRFPNSEVFGMDVSDKAIQVARENALALNLLVEFFVSDVLKMNQLNSCYDVIVSNPPYIPETESKLIHLNVLNYEPGLALFVPSKDPLLFYKKIAELAKDSLKAGGFFFFEVHENYAKLVEELLVEMQFSEVTIHLDLQGKERMVKGRINH